MINPKYKLVAFLVNSTITFIVKYMAENEFSRGWEKTPYLYPYPYGMPENSTSNETSLPLPGNTMIVVFAFGSNAS